MNKPSCISPHEVLQSRLIYTVYHSKGGGGLKREGGLINFLPLKKGGLLETGGLFEEGRGVNRGFTVCLLLLTPGTPPKIQLRGFSIQFQILKE